MEKTEEGQGVGGGGRSCGLGSECGKFIDPFDCLTRTSVCVGRQYLISMELF